MTEKERKIEKEKDQVHDKNVDDRPGTTDQTCRSSLFLTFILIMDDLFRKRTKKEARGERGVRKRELQSKPITDHFMVPIFSCLQSNIQINNQMFYGQYHYLSQ